MALTKTTYSMIDGAPLNVLDYGADPTGSNDSTTAIQNAINAAGVQGGGIVIVPVGTYLVEDLVIDYANVIVRGLTSGYSYDTSYNADVVFKVTSGATWGVHLAYTSSSRRATYSGLQNIFVITTDSVSYGVLISDGATIMDDVTVRGFEYGCSIAQLGNQNKFNRCSFLLNTKVGFAITEYAHKSYLYPGVTFNGSGASTIVTLRDCNIRQNDFGVIIREGNNVSFYDCVIESNAQSGLYMYLPGGAVIANTLFENCWFENNYSAYTSGSTSYSITGNNFLKITNSSTYITWTSAGNAGYQITFDAQTPTYPGGPVYTTFNNCNVNCGGTQQKGIQAIVCGYTNFNTCGLLGGDQANYIDFQTYASYSGFYEANGGISSIPTSIPGNRNYISRSGQNTYERGGLYFINSYMGAKAFQISNVTTSEVRMLGGTGSPEGVVGSGVGSIYLRADGGAGTSFYVKESGAGGTTGWVAK